MNDPFKPWPNSDGKIPMVSPHSEDVVFVDEQRWDYFKRLGWQSAYDYYRELWHKFEKIKIDYNNKLTAIKFHLDRNDVQKPTANVTEPELGGNFELEIIDRVGLSDGYLEKVIHTALETAKFSPDEKILKAVIAPNKSGGFLINFITNNKDRKKNNNSSKHQKPEQTKQKIKQTTHNNQNQTKTHQSKKKSTTINKASDLAAISGTFAAEMNLRKKTNETS